MTQEIKIYEQREQIEILEGEVDKLTYLNEDSEQKHAKLLAKYKAKKQKTK